MALKLHEKAYSYDEIVKQYDMVSKAINGDAEKQTSLKKSITFNEKMLKSANETKAKIENGECDISIPNTVTSDLPSIPESCEDGVLLKGKAYNILNSIWNDCIASVKSSKNWCEDFNSKELDYKNAEIQSYEHEIAKLNKVVEFQNTNVTRALKLQSVYEYFIALYPQPSVYDTNGNTIPTRIVTNTNFASSIKIINDDEALKQETNKLSNEIKTLNGESKTINDMVLKKGTEAAKFDPTKEFTAAVKECYEKSKSESEEYQKLLKDIKEKCVVSDDTTSSSSADSTKTNEVAAKISTDGATNAAATGNPIATNVADATKLASAVAGATNGGAAAVVTNMLNQAGIHNFPTIMDSEAPKTPYHAAGQDDVIMMYYELWMGNISNFGSPESLIANTFSYELGISLSEISWGFYNTSSTGDAEEANLRFTIHDIAGASFSNFVKLKSGAELIYFNGPTSAGYNWPTSNFAIYKPIPDSCTMEFSPTQGFTYSITASPVIGLAKSQYYMNPKEFTINGTFDNTNVVELGNNWQYYIVEFMQKWNAGISECKKDKSRITFDWGDNSEGIQDEMWNMTPKVTVKTKDQKQANPNAAIEPYAVPMGMNLADAISGLWQTRFVAVEADAAGKKANEGSNIEVNFKDYKEGETTVHLRLHKKEKTDKVESMKFQICIGSDLTCVGQIFRAQLVKLDFGNLTQILGASAYSTSPDSGEVSQSGNTSSETKCTDGEYGLTGAGQMKEDYSKVLNSTGPTDSGQQHGFNAWGELRDLLNRTKTAELTIEVELPYTYAFTPEAFGGWLKDAIDGSPSAGIHYTQGAWLFFFWYDSPKCDMLLPNPVITSEYRITKVMHTIGLNGNTTQVGLSHLHVSI